MRTFSTLAIEWSRPNLSAEQWEFSHHPAKQEFYLRHRISWENIVAADARGRFVPYPRAASINGIPVIGAYHAYNDYRFFLAKAKRGYRRSYSKMEEALQEYGTLSLPAPIILMGKEEAILFAGYRRLCLAWNYGMIPLVWTIAPLELE